MQIPTTTEQCHSVSAEEALQPQNVEFDFISSMLACLPVHPAKKPQLQEDEIYSFAVRSCWMAEYLYTLTSRADLALHGLMFYSAKAYLKEITPGTDGDKQFRQAIYRALELPPLKPDDVDLIKQAAQQVMYVEFEALLPEKYGKNYSQQIDEIAKTMGFYPGIYPWIAKLGFEQTYSKLMMGKEL